MPDHPDRHPSVAEFVAVGHASTLEVDAVIGRDQVVGTRSLCQDQATGHVVVVYVGLGNRLDSESAVLEELFDTVDVSLRIDDNAVGDVTSISQFARFDDLDLDHAVAFRGMTGHLGTVPDTGR